MYIGRQSTCISFQSLFIYIYIYIYNIYVSLSILVSTTLIIYKHWKRCKAPRFLNTKQVFLFQYVHFISLVVLCCCYISSVVLCDAILTLILTRTISNSKNVFWCVIHVCESVLLVNFYMYVYLESLSLNVFALLILRRKKKKKVLWLVSWEKKKKTKKYFWFIITKNKKISWFW